MATIVPDDQLKKRLVDADHISCGTESFDECGALEFHEQMAEDVMDMLANEGWKVVSDA